MPDKDTQESVDPTLANAAAVLIDTGEGEALVTVPAEQPYKIHPSAAAGTTEKPKAPKGVVDEYYIGQWSGRPLYGCPACTYSQVGMTPNGEDGSGQVGFHLETKGQGGDPAHFAVLHPQEA